VGGTVVGVCPVREDAKHLVAAYYPAVAADLLRPLLKFMSVSREYCDGDMIKFMVMLAVSVRTTMHRDFASRTQAELMSGAIPVFPGLGANARSIAEALGIPKETVRRKVSELIEVGWLAREKGKLYTTARSYQELAPAREQLEILAVRYFEVVAALKERTDSAAVGPQALGPSGASS
jgi:hypothetical protein